MPKTRADWQSKYEAAKELAERGATPGERAAGRAALQRLAPKLFRMPRLRRSRAEDDPLQGRIVRWP